MNVNFFPRTVSLCALSILCALCLFAASGNADDRIVIKGSNTFGEELAPVLTERYRKEHMAVTVFSIFLFKVLKVQNRV